MRGNIETSGWLLLPDERRHTIVAHITMVDFGGGVPRRAYDWIQARLPKGLAHLRALVRRCEAERAELAQLETPTPQRD